MYVPDSTSAKQFCRTSASLSFAAKTENPESVLKSADNRSHGRVPHSQLRGTSENFSSPLSIYLLYYHEDRTHLGLAKDTPTGRPTEIRSERESKIQSLPRLGGLHHRYAVAA
jgi:hypothetical protein